MGRVVCMVSVTGARVEHGDLTCVTSKDDTCKELIEGAR